ncbi:MAG: cell division protein FtsA [Planctomycetota bacterium]
MAKAVDIGTSFIVGARLENGNEVFTVERDAFFSMPREDLSEELITRAGANFLVRGDELFVVGEDALKYCMITGRHEAYRRPMKMGVLNPGEEEAIPLIERLIEGIVGKAEFPGEIIAATIPAAPLDAELDVTFHKIVLERFLKKLGYDVRILNEALAIIYAECPTVEDDGAQAPFSGIGISFGAGMTNLVVAWRAKKLFEISVARGGDWIDQRVAQVRNVPVGKVTRAKEKDLDLGNVDPRNPLHLGLEIFYEELIRHVLSEFATHFKSSQTTFSNPLDVVIAGGTASVPGFVDTFKRLLSEQDMPVPIGNVTLGDDPLRTVAKGALVAAVSMEKKKLKQEAEAKAKAEAEAAAKAKAKPPAPKPDLDQVDIDIEAGV